MKFSIITCTLNSEPWLAESIRSVDLLLALIALHVAGVVWSSVRHAENLVAAMITGNKRADDE